MDLREFGANLDPLYLRRNVLVMVQQRTLQTNLTILKLSIVVSSVAYLVKRSELFHVHIHVLNVVTLAVANHVKPS